MRLETVTLDDALNVLSLPRVVGTAADGYGPYPTPALWAAVTEDTETLAVLADFTSGPYAPGPGHAPDSCRACGRQSASRELLALRSPPSIQSREEQQGRVVSPPVPARRRSSTLVATS